ncbi:hypothetical protein M427DRAFT_49752 [Gonapodya prolifera JEL478]|uniref:CBM1 domain-containing protein n=1 Tax=Gonapodya prolifera (strain JEL478) TaxID=1344416 RepID=A0A138ZXL3_GONPJ|nr:hypothetical protein M427DRAFT_49752 [Gonapodya prolifera JEL478]|eukprot:KXS09242.1 hypothetical protein M427DRAFT_49752 [Gonapodya prolifera JEL478]
MALLRHSLIVLALCAVLLTLASSSFAAPINAIVQPDPVPPKGPCWKNGHNICERDEPDPVPPKGPCWKGKVNICERDEPEPNPPPRGPCWKNGHNICERAEPEAVDNEAVLHRRTTAGKVDTTFAFEVLL